MTNWILSNKKSIIRFSFLIPILLVAFISISHVIKWYDIANPFNWAIYLSIAIEIAAMSAISASSVKIKGFSIWFVFIIVTLIQFIGNIFFCYSEIDENSIEFKQWIELISPLFNFMSLEDSNDYILHKRFLSILEGGLLPLISLTCLHFFIKYGEIDSKEAINNNQTDTLSNSNDIEQYEKKIEEVLNSTKINEDNEIIKTDNEKEIDNIEETIKINPKLNRNNKK